MKRISSQALVVLALAASWRRSPGQESGTTVVTPARIVTVETEAGFDWTGAGIGAAGSFALAMIVVGVSVAARRPGGSRLAS